MEIKIFFDDLVDAKQREVLEAYKIGDLSEMNFEVNPLAILEIEESESENAEVSENVESESEKAEKIESEK